MTNSTNTHSVAAQADSQVDKDWWRGAVVYQIYPRSYQDSGTLDDCDALIQSAHQLGIKVIFDQVLSHSSDQHPWFVESRACKDNPRHDWYVWADPKPDGTPPNNWLSIFGGSAWQWDSRREQYYLHNFLTSQPDLNFHNPAVQDAVLEDCRFWLDRGVDGFRLDTVNFYFADKQLRDNPALTKEERNGSIAPSVNPYNHQRHIYSKNQPENLQFLERFRALLDEYPAATSVGEIGDAQFGLELLGEYTKGDKRLHMSYSFEFLSGDTLDASRLQDVFTRLTDIASDSWPCWALTNHDIKRHTTRWELDEHGRRLYALLMMCVRGSVCLYQGEELGLPEADIEFEDLQDPYGIEFWPEFKGRDGCRTPMVWNSEQVNGGFSEQKPWLPVPAEHVAMSVDVQEQENDSLLHYYRKVIDFRKQHAVLSKGQQTPLVVEGQVVGFSRTLDDVEMYCAFNIGSLEAEATLPDGHWTLIDADLGTSLSQQANRVMLRANQALLATKTT